MDLLSPSPTTNLPLVPVFGDNVQDLLGTGAINVNPSAIITVNSIADTVDDPNSGVTTLRDAINQANTDAGEDLIVFDRSLFSSQQTITLGGTELDITHNLDIIAPRDSLTGGDLVTVSGNKASRVFEIETGTTATLSGLIVADGSVTGDNGGGIKNSGTLTLDSSIVRNNNSGDDGGGIYSSANLTVNNSTINGNSAYNGGGIYNLNGTLTVNNSTISGNSAKFGSGGGIYNFDGTLTVNNSTISGNSTQGNGGGIYNFDASLNGTLKSFLESTLIVNNSTISGNSAFDGGGIDNYYSTITVNNSTISGNSAQYGGGIDGGFLTVNNSTISGNSAKFGSGGGIGSTALTVNNSTISGNSATEEGGGIYNTGTLTVNNSTISGNSATEEGGGIYNTYTLTVNNSTISGNSAMYQGGGIYNIAYASSTVTIDNSTISGNSAMYQGGGIYSYGDSFYAGKPISNKVAVTNSTISDNFALNAGGGIYNTFNSITTLLFSTVTQNIAANGGGIYQSDALIFGSIPTGSTSIRNAIIAANLNSNGGVNPDVSGTFTSNGYNLIGDGTGSTGFGSPGDIVGTSDNPIDPRLAPLDFNGGSTQTIALLSDSPAIGAGDPTVLDTDPTTDQRGLPRRALDGSTDIGAFEFSV